MPANRIPSTNSTMIVTPIVRPRTFWPIKIYPDPGTSQEHSATSGGAEKGPDEFDIERDTLSCRKATARRSSLLGKSTENALPIEAVPGRWRSVDPGQQPCVRLRWLRYDDSP